MIELILVYQVNITLLVDCTFVNCFTYSYVQGFLSCDLNDCSWHHVEATSDTADVVPGLERWHYRESPVGGRERIMDTVAASL